MTKWFVALVCCLALVKSTPAIAQERPHVHLVVTNVHMSTPTDGLIRSALLAASRTPLRAQESVAQPNGHHERNWMQRHPVLTWALVGFGAGFGLSYAATTDNPDSGSVSPSARALLYGGAGAGVGALISWGIERSRIDDEPDYLRAHPVR